MSMKFSSSQLALLKDFVGLLRAQPEVLHDPSLGFFRRYLEELGANVPETKPTPPPPKAEPEPAPAEDEDEEMPPLEEDEVEEPEPVDPDVIPAETDAPQPMGDSSKEPSDEGREKASELRGVASEHISNGELDKAIEALTEAITKHNGGSAPLYATRGQTYLKLKKPASAIRDADAAIKLNPDSAAAYRVRGRANGLLGHWEQAVADLQKANMCDYDPDVNEQIKTYTPKAHAVAERRKAKEAREKARSQKSSSSSSSSGGGFPSGAGGFPGGFPGGAGGFPFPGMGGFPGAPGGGAGGAGGIPQEFMSKLMSDPDFLTAIQDPEVMPILSQLATDPSQIEKYKDHPKLGKLFSKFSHMFQK